MIEQFCVTKEIEFDAGHRVPLHDSQCRNPHGHRYRVIATWAGYLQETGSATGMVLDFGELKSMLMKIHDEYDHAFIYCQTDDWARYAFRWSTMDRLAVPFKTVMLDVVPTAENLARAFFWDLHLMTSEKYEDNKVRLREVLVYETPTSVATYRGDVLWTL